MNFSYFKPPVTSNITPLKTMDLRNVWMIILSDELKAVTQKVRSGKASKTDILPFITASGQFRKRNLQDLITYSGIISIDLDNCDIEMKSSLENDPFLQPSLIFVSPSGTGLKLFYQLAHADSSLHLTYFNAITTWLKEHYLLSADMSCNDIPRCCLLCHDPTAWFSDQTIESADLVSYLEEFQGSSVSKFQTETLKHCNIETPETELNKHPLVHQYAVAALKSAGWKDVGKDRWRRPGKEKETSAAYKFYDPYECHIFYNFSDNGHPFEANKGYNDLGIIAALEYGGDNSRCVQALYEKLGIPWKAAAGSGSGSTAAATATATATEEEDYFNDNDIATVLDEGSRAKEQRKIGGAFLYEDTTTYIFSRTNYGKSLLVFQLAWAAATGTSIAGCSALQNNCEPMKVLVVDLELEPRVLYKRHGLILNKKSAVGSNGKAAVGSGSGSAATATATATEREPLLKNLRYLHEKMDKSVSTGLKLLEKIERYAVKHQAQLVIIDNISKLLPDSLKPELVTQVIDALNKIRKRTGASMLVIGHTIKGNPKIAIQPTDYFGSSMVQNFFSEVSFLDMTTDGRFFLCQSKTKQKECYTESVPVFTRGEHPVVGVGFSYETLMNLSDIQLPYVLQAKVGIKKRNLKHYLREISILDNNGVSRSTIAEMMGVTRPTIYNLFDP